MMPKLSIKFFVFLTIFIVSFYAIYKGNVFETREHIREFKREIRDKRRELFISGFKEQKEELIDFMVVYDAFDSNGKLELKRYGHYGDGGYIVPVKSFEEASALLGYGVGADSSFEEDFSARHNKPSFGFDCSVYYPNKENSLYTFVDECIGTTEYIPSEKDKAQLKVTTFEQQLKNFDLEGKKVFVKMDIEGAEFEVMDGILNNAHLVTGIAMELHSNPEELHKPLELLSRISKDFILVYMHPTNCTERFSSSNAKGKMTYTMELTFINKNLVDEYKISDNQKHPTSLDAPICPKMKEAVVEIIPHNISA